MTDVSKNFGQEKVLNQINLTISDNELVVLLGPSGAGKSTLLRCINGLERVSAGSVSVDGKQVTTNKKELRLLRKNIGMIFQQFHLVKRMSVLDNVLCGRLAYTGTLSSIFKRFERRDYELTLHYLEKVGLVDKRNARADELSGGQQQRVAIARSLVQEPKLLLADEPVASLDPKTANSILELLSLIKNEEKLTVVITLHQMDLAKKYGKRIVGLNNGQIVADMAADLISIDELYQLYEDQALISQKQFSMSDQEKVAIHA
ncbi:phosphonate ABC transporter ATP-binding protein [Paenibacillus solisilvae]